VYVASDYRCLCLGVKFNTSSAYLVYVREVPGECSRIRRHITLALCANLGTGNHIQKGLGLLIRYSYQDKGMKLLVSMLDETRR
jgi:hypothetical protein